MATTSLGASAFAQSEPRERIGLNDNWRFIKGNPADIDSESLLYDVRPVARGEDQKERLAESVDLDLFTESRHPRQMQPMRATP